MRERGSVMRFLRDKIVKLCFLIMLSLCLSDCNIPVQAQELWNPIEDYVINQMVQARAQDEVTISSTSFTSIPDTNVTLTGVTSDSILEVKYFLVVKVPIAAASYIIEFGLYEPAGIEAGPWVNQSSGANMWMTVSWGKIFQRADDPLSIKVMARNSLGASFQVFDRRLEVIEFVPKTASAGELGRTELAALLLIIILIAALPITYKAGKKANRI